jgi:hypothetical protein
MLILNNMACVNSQPKESQLSVESSNSNDSAISPSTADTGSVPNDCILKRVNVIVNGSDLEMVSFTNALGKRDSIASQLDFQSIDQSIESFWQGPITLLEKEKFARTVRQNYGLGFAHMEHSMVKGKESEAMLSMQDKATFFKLLKNQYQISVKNPRDIKSFDLNTSIISNNANYAVNYYTVDFHGYSESWGQDTTLGRFSVVIIRDCRFKIKNIVTIPGAIITNLMLDSSGQNILYTHLEGVEEEGITLQEKGLYLLNIETGQEIKLPEVNERPFSNVILYSRYEDGFFQVRVEGGNMVLKYYISPSQGLVLYKIFPFGGYSVVDSSFKTNGRQDDLSSFEKLRF